MGSVGELYDGWEYYVARAEIAFHENHYQVALTNAQLAQQYADTKARKTAIGIFIAKCYAALGDYTQSSQTYRALIQDGAYLPPLFMGLMYNHLAENHHPKAKRDLTIIKIFADGAADDDN